MTVILEDRTGQEIVRIANVPESSVLMQRGTGFPLLSQLDNVSYTVYGPEDVNELLRELAVLCDRATDVVTRSYLARVTEVVQQCADEPSRTLAFTPFE